MSNIVLRTDGKKIVCNMAKDEKIYDAPVNPPNTGTTYTYGTDLYAHTARSGKVYFYSHTWSMWQGSADSYDLMSASEVEQFFLSKMGGNEYIRPSQEEIARASQLLARDLLEETA